MSETVASILLRKWIDFINEQTQLGLEVTAEHICAIENQDGSVLLVQALDDAGVILLSSVVTQVPSEDQLSFFKAVSLANYRDLVTGPSKLSLHPNGKDLYLERPLFALEQYQADQFAEELSLFMEHVQNFKQYFANGQLRSWSSENFKNNEFSTHGKTGIPFFSRIRF